MTIVFKCVTWRSSYMLLPDDKLNSMATTKTRTFVGLIIINSQYMYIYKHSLFLRGLIHFRDSLIVQLRYYRK